MPLRFGQAIILLAMRQDNYHFNTGKGQYSTDFDRFA